MPDRVYPDVGLRRPESISPCPSRPVTPDSPDEYAYVDLGLVYGAPWLPATVAAEPEIPMPRELEARAEAWEITWAALLGIPAAEILGNLLRDAWGYASAVHMSYRRECMRLAGAEHELEYYRHPTTDTWRRLWSPDYTRVLWDSRHDTGSIEDFMRANGHDSLPMTEDHGAGWRTRWSGRIELHAEFGTVATQNIHYLSHLTIPPNPIFEENR